MPERKGGKGGTRKIGRDKDKCKAYSASGRRVVNKRAKLKRHLRKYPNDTCAQTASQRLHGVTV